ncbi:MAG: type II toxin-antitoxin system VapC family toxin [Bacteroidota bacterium]
MRPLLYVETTVVSYLTARPSANLVAAARQLLTQTWWERERNRYRLIISPVVLQEAGRGDPEAAQARLDALNGIEAVALSSAAQHLAQGLADQVPLPPKAATDALHIAAAAAAGADLLLTWNFRHIANPTLRERIAHVCRSEGYGSPVLCTPEDLLGDAL